MAEPLPLIEPPRGRRVRNFFRPPKFVSSFASFSSLREKNIPVKIDFPDGFTSGSLYDWYTSLSPKSRYIKSLQIRRDIGGVVPHRFVMLHMEDDQTHRFDRRPQQARDDHRPDYNLFELAINTAVKSEDSFIARVNRLLLKEIELMSYCEIELFFGQEQQDLLAVISACFAISTNHNAQNYTLLRHNCFFFSWTILLVVCRYRQPYRVPSFESVKAQFTSKVNLGRITILVADMAVELFLEFVIETVIKTWDGLGDVGVPKFLPDSVLRFLWRRYAALRLTFGLRKQIVHQVEVQVEARLFSLYNAIAGIADVPEKLDSNLWIEESSELINAAISDAIAKFKWEVVLDVLSGGLGEQVEEMPMEDVDGHIKLKKSLLGKRFAQFNLVWNAAIPAGLDAVKNANRGDHSSLSDEDVFDLIWSSARVAVFDSVNNVVTKTNAQVKSPKREAVWSKIFDMWNQIWTEAHDSVRPMSLDVLSKIMEELTKVGTGSVVQVIKEYRENAIEGRILKVRSFLPF